MGAHSFRRADGIRKPIAGQPDVRIASKARLSDERWARVLLTRARQGMVIYIPKGDASDKTRSPQFYDGTFEFLKSCGLEELAGA